jgi:hypothetical protein
MFKIHFWEAPFALEKAQLELLVENGENLVQVSVTTRQETGNTNSTVESSLWVHWYFISHKSSVNKMMIYRLVD